MNRRERRAMQKVLRRVQKRNPDAGVPQQNDPPSGTNAYRCDLCGQVILTRHANVGVTPMFLACRATEGCDGQMVSSMYPAGPIPAELAECPVFEWYRPEASELSTVAEARYVADGGLALRGPV